jgi:hypothetical protein
MEAKVESLWKKADRVGWSTEKGQANEEVLCRVKDCT